MQRKVFYQAGAPILATRGDGFFETAGTLQQLIEEGRAQQRDLAQWLQPEAAEAVAAEVEVEVLAMVPDLREIVPLAAPAPRPDPTPEPEPVSPAAPAEADMAAPETEAAPKRPRQKRRRAPVTPQVDPVAMAAIEEAIPEPEPAATPEPEPALAGPPDAAEADAPARLAARATGDAQSAEERGKRWLMAGAARRGRAGKHWSTRQR
ncbi:hypothetical protein [Dankookia sp. GCM10030260]|uniref:hypothetical protein n=1 Tax=Dankookia sp. GCM10030260 TaxID=3273390 RepID=UPI0036D3C227